jgi:hypothetical protein
LSDFINRPFFGFVSSAIFIGILAPAHSQPGHQKSLVEPAEEFKASANATFTSSALTSPISTFRGRTRDISIALDGNELTVLNALTRLYGNVVQFDLTADTFGKTSSPAFGLTTQTPSNAFGGSACATFSGGNSYTLNAALTGPIIQDRLFFGLEAGLQTIGGFYCNTFLDSDVVDDNTDIHAGARLL